MTRINKFDVLRTIEESIENGRGIETLRDYVENYYASEADIYLADLDTENVFGALLGYLDLVSLSELSRQKATLKMLKSALEFLWSPASVVAVFDFEEINKLKAKLERGIIFDAVFNNEIERMATAGGAEPQTVLAVHRHLVETA